MYTVTRLYVVARSKITLYLPSELTPAAFQAFTDVNSILFISVQNPNSGQKYGVNYSRWMSDSDITAIDTWGAVGARITDAVIAGYQETIPGYAPGSDSPDNVVVVYDVMNTIRTFNINYADHLSELSGIEAYKWNLLDLSIQLQPEAQYQPNLKNCLPVVNGLACRPYLNGEQTILYALGGAQLCWQGGTHHTPEIQLLDFSSLGEVSTHPLCLEYTQDEDRFTVAYANRNNKFSLSADWLITNEKYSLYEYTPLLVVGGTIYFPDEYTLVNEHTFRINLQKHALDVLLAYRNYMQDKANSDADISYTGEVTADFIQAETTADKFSENTFVLLVKCPRIWVTRVNLDVWMNGITINSLVLESILHHLRTNTLRSYHVNTYSDYKELTVQNMEEIYVSDYPCDQAQITFIRPDCAHHDFDNIHRGDCEMIYVLR